MIWKLIVPPLCQKWLFFINLGQGLSEKVDFYSYFLVNFTT